MWSHVLRVNCEVTPEVDPFPMIIISQHKISMSRQIEEALEIGNSKLKSKDDYTRCFLPNLTVEGNTFRPKGFTKYVGNKISQGGIFMMIKELESAILLFCRKQNTQENKNRGATRWG